MSRATRAETGARGPLARAARSGTALAPVQEEAGRRGLTVRAIRARGGTAVAPVQEEAVV